MLAFLMADLQNFLENLFKFGLNVGPHNLTFALTVTLKFFIENLQVWVVPANMGRKENVQGRQKEERKEDKPGARREELLEFLD